MLSYQRWSSGSPTALLIHGLLGTHELWDKTAPLLEGRYDVLASICPATVSAISSTT